MTCVQTAACLTASCAAFAVAGWAYWGGTSPQGVGPVYYRQAVVACAANHAYTRALMGQCLTDYRQMVAWSRHGDRCMRYAWIHATGPAVLALWRRRIVSC